MTTTPQILPVLSDSGDWLLYAQTRFGLTIAGPRLFRAPPFPEVAWRSATEEEATKQARTLQQYLDSVYAKRTPSKAAVRTHGD